MDYVWGLTTRLPPQGSLVVFVETLTHADASEI